MCTHTHNYAQLHRQTSELISNDKVYTQTGTCAHTHTLMNTHTHTQFPKNGRVVLDWLVLVFGPPKAAPILFLLSLEVSGTSGMMSVYIYIYIYIYIVDIYIYIYILLTYM